MALKTVKLIVCDDCGKEVDVLDSKPWWFLHSQEVNGATYHYCKLDCASQGAWRLEEKRLKANGTSRRQDYRAV